MNSDPSSTPDKPGPEPDDTGRAGNALLLEHFLPYRLSVLSNTISRTLARSYGAQFGLNLMEWRVMAILGRFPDISASEVASYGAMDKVAVSRAVRTLRAAARIIRRTARDDRRRSVLRLSASGRRLYEQIVPMARTFEAELLQALGPEDHGTLDRLLQRLTERSRALEEA